MLSPFSSWCSVCPCPSVRAGLDFYGFVRLINYLRSSKPLAEQFVSLLATIAPGATPPWESDEYLVSVVQDDPMLQYGEEGEGRGGEGGEGRGGEGGREERGGEGRGGEGRERREGEGRRGITKLT